jgi:5'-nucleotidase
MGAAIEGSFYGVPSIGLSLDDHDADADFEGAVMYGRKIIAEVLAAADRLPRPLCLNVNVPRCAAGDIQGIRLCRQTRGFWREDFFRREDPHGREYFWLTGAFQNSEPDAEDTDEWALAHRYVAVVPVQVDMTDYGMLRELDGVIS